MFCKELQITNEEFYDLLIELKNDKMEGSFELDIVKIGSMDKLRQIIALDNTARIFQIGVGDRGVLYGGLEYDNNGEVIIGLINIKVNEIGKSYLSVYSKQQAFRETIVKNLLDILACIR